MKRLFVLVLFVIRVSGIVAQTEFEQLVEERGLRENMTDVSNADKVQMEEPRLAFVNLTGISYMPVSKGYEQNGWMECYDGNGLYFKKRVKIGGQGGYSLKFPKRNFVCHFCDEAWNESGGADFKIGNWVKQDAFHFKAFYTDVIRGVGEVGYKVFAHVVADRIPYWERAGYHNESEARCFPDAFPCVVYLNGKFYGIYAWQLKKHHKNMNQKKTVAEHVHLDGNLRDDYLFRGTIKWNEFEVRNPKNLYANTGVLYNGNRPSELMDEQSAYYHVAIDDATVVAAKQQTAKVKSYIVGMSKYWAELNDIMNKCGGDAETMRKAVEERYDIEGLIDYAVFYYFSQNGDGTLKNWQWFTYDGKHWTVTPYDLDQTFGLGLFGNLRPADFPIADLTSGPFYWIHKYYQDDIRKRYAELRFRKVFDYDQVIAIIDDWYNRIGTDFFDKEMTSWPESPCYCDAICNEGWEWCDDWSLYSQVKGYSATVQYHAGDVCILEGKLWRATTDVIGIKPFLRNANKDDIDRLRDWVAGRIAFTDAMFAFNPEDLAVHGITSPSADRRLLGIFSLSGMPVSTPVSGQVYIFRYSDGSAQKVMAR